MTVRSNPQFVDTGISKCVVLEVRLYLIDVYVYFVRYIYLYRSQQVVSQEI